MSGQKGSASSFFLLTFGITWGLQLPGVFAQRGLLPGNPEAYLPFVGLGIFGPIVAATILTSRTREKGAVKALFRRMLLWRVAPRWYLLVLLLPALLLSAGLALMNMVGRSGPITYLPTTGGVIMGLLISASEEIGWRGYAQPNLEERWGPVGASIIVGVYWALWHIPMFLGVGVPLDLMPVMLLLFTGGSLFFTWILQNTGGSLLLVSLAHFGAHLNNSHRALPLDTVPLLVHAIIWASLGLFLMRRQLALRFKHAPGP